VLGFCFGQASTVRLSRGEHTHRGNTHTWPGQKVRALQKSYPKYTLKIFFQLVLFNLVVLFAIPGLFIVFVASAAGRCCFVVDKYIHMTSMDLLKWT